MPTVRCGQHAIVIGASAAGMMAAKVLAAHFDRVSVIERDQLPDAATPRKGLPQAPHAHALLLRGLQVMERLFPDLVADLVQHGAIWAETSADVLWHQFGATRLRTETGLDGLLFGRPLLDWRMRTHLQREANVRLLDGHRVKGFLLNPERSAATGVNIESTTSGAMSELKADLVVDGGGRGSQTATWLAEYGLGQVPLSEVKAKVEYLSSLYRLRALPDWKVGFVATTPPETPLAVAFAVEGAQTILTIQTMFGEPLPSDHAGVLEFLKALPHPALYEAFQQAEPVGQLHRYSSPSNLRRHFERMAQYPDGLIVVGDAACCFNPRYGQGMTTAAISAELLATCLAEQSTSTTAGLARKFQQRLAPLLDLPWQVSTGEDLRFPQVEGARPLPLKLMNAFLIKLFQLVSVDREALEAVLKLQHMTGSIALLLKPRLIWRALTYRAPH